MCKYCDGSGTPLASDETDHRDAEIRIDGNTLIADLQHDYLTAEIAFCPKCGTPLGEVKPLTVEQLKTINADMKNRRWVWIKVLQGVTDSDKVSAYYRVHKDYTNGEMFCCGYPGLSFGFSYSDYGTTWIAFDREPKGEAE